MQPIRSKVYRIFILFAILALAAGCNLPGAPAGEGAEPTSATVIAPLADTPGGPPTQAPPQQSQIETVIAELKSQTPPTPIPAQASDTPQPPTPVTPSPAPAQATAEGPAAPTRPEPAGPQLAFLKDKDIWLLDEPGGQPYQLSVAGDILSFAWSPDGQRLAAFNGKTVCFLQRDGSVRSACLDLGLDDNQAKVERRIVWSPDQTWLALWNPVNPWDEGAIGWLIVALDSSNTTYRIQDPVDWGASLAPNNEAGGITGQPVFLPDGKLVGTLTHRILCSSGGCHYQLFQFDLQNRVFTVYPNQPEEGWSEGMRLEVSHDGRILTNYGVFFFGCDSYITFADDFNLADQTRQTYNLENQALADMALHPAGGASLIARTAGCSSQAADLWSQVCGLSQGFEVYPMQLWERAAGKFTDLAPGLEPAWSPDGKWLVFRSCLAQSGSNWKASAETPAGLYVWYAADNTYRPLGPGSQAQWRPK